MSMGLGRLIFDNYGAILGFVFFVIVGASMVVTLGLFLGCAGTKYLERAGVNGKFSIKLSELVKND